MSEEIENNPEDNTEIIYDKPYLDLDKQKIILPPDINAYNLSLLSEKVFETPIARCYVSLFLNRKKKNIHINNIFKFCVLLGCSPNDLMDYENWEYKVSQVLNKGKKVTNDQIKEML